MTDKNLRVAKRVVDSYLDLPPHFCDLEYLRKFAVPANGSRVSRLCRAVLAAIEEEQLAKER